MHRLETADISNKFKQILIYTTSGRIFDTADILFRTDVKFRPTSESTIFRIMFLQKLYSQGTLRTRSS